jgi:hypothetical protein
VYEIVTVPADTPVTTPVVPTVAIAVLEEDHVPPEVESVNVVVEPVQILLGPKIALTTGGLLVQLREYN